MLETVSFRGTKSGLMIVFDEESIFEEIADALKKKLDESGYFFFGASVFLDSGSIDFSRAELLRIREELRDKHGLNVISIKTKSEITQKNAKELNWKIIEPEEKEEPESSQKIELEKKEIEKEQEEEVVGELPTKIFQQSLRSGQFLEYDGNLVILGDINAGAEVIATGDIIIFGTLRGMAFAGAKGRKESFILANKLKPTQIRIADKLARADENADDTNPESPEYAFIEGEGIVIDVWHKRKI